MTTLKVTARDSVGNYVAVIYYYTIVSAIIPYEVSG